MLKTLQHFAVLMRRYYETNWKNQPEETHILLDRAVCADRGVLRLDRRQPGAKAGKFAKELSGHIQQRLQMGGLLGGGCFRASGKKEQFWAEADRFKGKIRISDYEVRQVDSKGKGGLATAILHLQYWRPESPILQSVTFTQKWYYTEKDKLWRVSDTGFEAITRGRAEF